MYQQPPTAMMPIAHPSIVPGPMRQSLPLQQVNMSPMQPPSLAQQQALQFQQAQQQQQQAARKKMMEEWDEPEGDELDNLSIRDVAVARYRRNHDYIAEIFSPYHINDILPPESSSSTQNTDELKEKIVSLQNDLTELNQAHDQKMKTYTASLRKLSQGVEKIASAVTLQDTEKIANSVAQDAGLKIVDEPLSTPIQLSYIKEDDMQMGIPSEASAEQPSQPTETTQQSRTNGDPPTEQAADVNTFDSLMDSDFITNDDSDMFEIGS